jgi:histidyl-tRNA synthetase
MADVEVMALLWRFLTGLRLPALTLEVNSLGDAEDRRVYRRALVDYLTLRADRLCSNCRRRMIANPLRVLDCKVPDCRAVTAEAPKLTDYLSSASKQHFTEVLDRLDGLEIPYVVNPRLVRGLDYYSQTTFEVTTTALGAQNAVGAGGRYDGLVEVLDGPKTPAVGFAIGLERVVLLLPESSLHPASRPVYVAAFGAQGLPLGLRILDDLRRNGIPSDMDYRASTLKGHLRQADRIRALFAVIIGDDEAAKGEALIRNMDTKAQDSVPLSDLLSDLGRRLRHTGTKAHFPVDKESSNG